MRILIYAWAGLIAAVAAGPAETLNAAENVCAAPVIAQGVSTHVEGSDDWKAFSGKIPQGLARQRAIAAWEHTIAARCPASSTHWSRASGQHVECEGAMGHEYCTASATPARKPSGLRSRG